MPELFTRKAAETSDECWRRELWARSERLAGMPFLRWPEPAPPAGTFDRLGVVADSIAELYAKLSSATPG